MTPNVENLLSQTDLGTTTEVCRICMVTYVPMLCNVCEILFLNPFYKSFCPSIHQFHGGRARTNMVCPQQRAESSYPTSITIFFRVCVCDTQPRLIRRDYVPYLILYDTAQSVATTCSMCSMCMCGLHFFVGCVVCSMCCVYYVWFAFSVGCVVCSICCVYVWFAFFCGLCCV